jgi:hypothetical protein
MKATDQESRAGSLPAGIQQRPQRLLALIQEITGSLSREAGRSLPAALIALAVGSILLTPFLSFVSSRSLGGGAAEETFQAQYAADAGIEFGCWALLNRPAFRSLVDLTAGTPHSLAFPGTLNGYTPSITVTGLPLGFWYVRQSAPATIERGGALAYPGGDRIYVLRGDNSRDFWYYSISGDSWGSLASTPGNVRQGGALVYGGGNFLYALRGNNQNDFWRYNITTDNWASMQNTPANVRQGGALAYNGGNFIYAFRGNSSDFWRYNISSDSWSSRTSAPNSTGYGADLVATNSNTLYAFRGANSTAFWRYNATSDSWTSLQDTPSRVNNGGSLTYLSGSYLYGLQGTSTDFWRYAVTMDSWTTLAGTPASVGRGGDLIFSNPEGGFALRGGNQTDFWEFEVTPPRYDISSQAGTVTTDARLEIDGSTKRILFWDID